MATSSAAAPTSDGEHALRDAHEVLQGDGGRVDVGEGVVHLVDEDDEEEHPAGGERQQRVDEREDEVVAGERRAGRVEGEQVGGAEEEEPDVGDGVGDEGRDCGAAAVAGVAAVVGDERQPRDRQRDGDIDGEPEAESRRCRGGSRSR